MAIESFLEIHNPELAASLRRVQGRGGRSNQVFARRRGAFVAILNFLAGWLAGRGQGTSRSQLERRRERVRRRLTEVGSSYQPERGECVIDWSSDSDVSVVEPKARSRSPVPSASSLLVVRPKARPKTAAVRASSEGNRTGYSSGSGEIGVPSVGEECSLTVHPPTPPTPRPKAPSGSRTPTPPPGRASGINPPEPIAPPPGPPPAKAAAPGPPPAKAAAPQAEGTVIHLSFPARHYWDLHDFATQLFGNVARGTPKLWIVSFDWHGVWDTISLDEGRQLIRRLGERADTLPLWCSYASEHSPHRPNTLHEIRQLARYLRAALAVAHTNAKSSGEGAKHNLLWELHRIAGSQLPDTDVRILHIDDSSDVVRAVNRLGGSISAVQWDGRRHPRWNLSETVFYYVGEGPQ